MNAQTARVFRELICIHLLQSLATPLWHGSTRLQLAPCKMIVPRSYTWLWGAARDCATVAGSARRGAAGPRRAPCTSILYSESIRNGSDSDLGTIQVDTG